MSSNQLAVSQAARSDLKKHQPCILWLTGLSGSGKSTIAYLIEQSLNRLHCHTYLLDGDNMRRGISQDLGYSDSDRAENIRRIAEVAALMADAGLIVIVALISPQASHREKARQLANGIKFFEIFVDTPLDVAETRDPKGLYKAARRGDVKLFTGIHQPYDIPVSPDITLATTRSDAQNLADVVVQRLHKEEIIPRHRDLNV